MKEALLRNPENFRMKEYIDAIERTPDPLARYRATLVPAILDDAGRYPDEAAVVRAVEIVGVFETGGIPLEAGHAAGP